jgi:choline dehydrogenase-like flavoprotein
VEAITPEEMEPYFQRVERFLSAKHQDPDSIGIDNRLLKEGAEKKGWKVIDNVRNQVHCSGTNNCAFGCPTGAKRSVLVTYLPRALAFGARVYADCKVEKLITHGNRISGLAARVVAPDGSLGARLVVKAKAVVVACGAIQTPALLMRSGIRSESERIGTDLALHPNTKVQAVFKEKVDGWKGVHQAYQVRQFEEEGIVFAAVNVPPGILAMTMPHYGKRLHELMGQYHRIVNAGILLEDSQFGRVRLGPGGVPLPFYTFSDRDAERAVRGTALLCELLFAAGAQSIASPFHGLPDLNSPDDVKKLYQWKIRKADIELFTVHLMGTARMGGDPRRHVCDSYGKVYGAEGLWVSDASLFPSPIGVNPMETIMSLSTRNAQRMIETAARWKAAA